MHSDKPTCFIIQKFDSGGPFDKRYKEIIEPTLKSLNVKPLRADEILGLNPIVEKIENAIRNADLCIAEISTDNPNVWMELGYALALEKPTIMICEKARREKLPFDVQHRPVIFYSSESKSSYKELEEKLKNYIEHELNSFFKILSPSGNKNKIDLLQEQLKVMCWESNRWNIYPLGKFTVRPENEDLTIINSTFIHRFARVIYNKKLNGNFNSVISLTGEIRSIALFSTDCQDRALFSRPSEQQIETKDECKFKISRRDNIIKLQTSTGKRLHYQNHRAHEDMGFYVGITLYNDAVVKIYSWEVEDESKKIVK